MKTNCAYCGKELERQPSRAKRRCFCNNFEVMAFCYESGVMNGSTIMARAHEALASKNWNRGTPKPMLAGENGPSKRPEVRAKISAAKLERNWMRGRTGKLHHLFLGGKIWWRGKEWDDQKLRARQRDGFMCSECDMAEWRHIQLLAQPLHVHHIIAFRISHDSSMQNLQTLCDYCHGKKKREELALIEQCRDALELSTGSPSLAVSKADATVMA